ncbi:MAG: 8-oxo-dGTP diphosphatase [Acidobacteria bacterium]|nr:MAG: 8-oxo-dGTP diphosphatase [Acidobacteriota bacterium]REK04554.1 MAG: 8-oxo-dGTP diphosphatase [Acidobacteriota bacterium]
MSSETSCRAAGQPRPRTAHAAAWQGWRPDDRATLTFVRRGDEVLLIRKKRGLGAGKINGPGGKLDPGESFAESAVREVEEELLVTPTGLERAGTLAFQFVDGYGIFVAVFTASGLHGTARETDEATPLWTPIDRIPYAEMWKDDELWLPWMFAGRRFAGRFVFDDDEMLAWSLEERETVALDIDEAVAECPDGIVLTG